MSSTEQHEAGVAETGHARLIRHAQASWGAEDYDRLSPLGETQAQHLAEWLVAEGDSYTQVIRGDLRRHAQTLDTIEAVFAAAGRPLPAMQIDSGWNEFDHVPILAAYAAAHGDDVNLAAARDGDHAVPSITGIIMSARMTAISERCIA